MLGIKEIVSTFIKEELNKESILLENFNEKSLQHNLGQYIKERLGKDYCIQYERNIEYFKRIPGVKCLSKKEVDITILDRNDLLHNKRNAMPLYVIEIKYLKAYSQNFSERTAYSPQSLYECLYDIQFIEDCKIRGIDGISLILCDDDKIHSANIGKVRKYKTIASIFRSGGHIDSEIAEQINEDDNNNKYKKIRVFNKYLLKWNPILSYQDEENHDLVLKYIINEGKDVEHLYEQMDDKC